MLNTGITVLGDEFKDVLLKLCAHVINPAAWCDFKMEQPRVLSRFKDIEDRAIFVWPWNKNAQTKQKQQTNGKKAIWLVYRTDTNARGFLLVKQTLRGWKKLHAREL